MASSSTASKPIQKILDSTKVASLSKFVRRPPIDPQSPIQGRPRQPGSNAYKEHEHRESRRLQKALDSISHGKHIFVYQHMRTNQVVYSLTRYLEKTNLLRQMIYHGKKTVPADIRRDMWVPYYSVHFGDSRLGLRAYQLLREFSKLRQLAPPPEMITVTEKFLAQKRPRDPVGAEEFDKVNKKRIGCTMEKKERARVLMDQKATSVADIAAVLAIQEEEKSSLLDDEKTPKRLTRKALKRVRDARRREDAKAEENSARVAALEEHLSKQSGEEVKIVDNDGDYPHVVDEVKILWRDMQDAHHAESWPGSVEHGELELKRSTIIGKEVIDGSIEIVAEDAFKEREKPQERS